MAGHFVPGHDFFQGQQAAEVVYDHYVDVIEADKGQAVSEGGGNHWTIVAGQVAPDALEDITSGDFVVVGDLHGVALIDYDPYLQAVVICTEGAHYLPIAGTDDVLVGMAVYYDETLGVLHVDADEAVYSADKAVGLAMAGRDADDLVPVKLYQTVPEVS